MSTGLQSTNGGDNSGKPCCSGFMTNPRWWRSAASFAGSKWKHFVLPAAALTGSNILAVGADALLTSGMKGEDVELAKLALCGLLALAASICALGIAFWALYVWFIRLVAFCGEWFSSDAGNPKDMVEIGNDLKKDKAFVSALMLWSSLYLMAPAIPLSVLIAINILCSPRFTVLGQRILDLPQPAVVAINATIAVLSGLIVAYTLIFIALAGAADDKSAKSVSFRALQTMIRNVSVTVVVSLAVAAINVLLTAPQLILLCTPMAEQVSGNVVLNMSAQVWLGIASVVIWPLSLVPFCQLVRFGLQTPVADRTV